MRYTNWDVLLFPEVGDIKTPLQEFSISCSVTQDPGEWPTEISPCGTNFFLIDVPAVPSTAHPAYLSTVTRPLPTLSCYIPSLPYGTPFRVSLHSWSVPVPTRATASMVSPESMVWFEARVLLDGICIAGTLFNQDPSWPQVIDTRSHVDKANDDQIRFPPFHTEMLTQVWADAAQNLGRVKVIIAEGIRHSHGNTGFQRIKNLVIFSFQHAPLNILENCGIAWPNPGMWLQAQQQFHSIASPRKDPGDIEAHAHSPRRRDVSMKMSRTRLDAAMGPPPNTYELMSQTGLQGRGLSINESYPTKTGADPFVGGISFNNFYKNIASRNTTGTEDVTMKSRSTSSSHDQPMPDASRITSPASSLRRRPIDYPEAQAPPVASTRKASEPADPCVGGLGLMHVGTALQNRHWQKEIEGEREENESHFADMMAAFSPSRKEPSLSGISAPSNTRANSAANSPLGPYTRHTTSLELGVTSGEDHHRSVSVTTRDPPLPTAHVPCITANSRSDSCNPESHQSESQHDANQKAETTIKKKPIGRPRGRKEGKPSEHGLEIPVNSSERKTSTGTLSINGKENTDESDEKTGDGKRKRMSNVVGSKVALKDRVGNPDLPSPTRKVSKTGLQDDIAAKLGEMDALMEQDVVVRQPLGELENTI